MYIKNIHIVSFGALKDRHITFEKGLNIIEGKNEAGKSTVAMFIKFMLYGLSGRGSDGEMSERRRYVSWDTGSAEGTMTVCTSDGEYKIERELYVSGDGAGDAAVRERVFVTDTSSGERVFRDQIPGVALMGIPEKVFVNTVFVKQSGGKVDGEGLAEAIENILLSGDESLSTKKAAERLDKVRKALMYKKRSGGLIYELEREEERLAAKLEEAKKSSAEIIALECSVGELQETVESRVAESEHCGALVDAYDKLKKKRKLDEARAYKNELRDADTKLAEFEKYGNITDKTRNIQRLSGEADNASARIGEIRRRLDEIDRTLPPELGSGDAADLRDEVRDCEAARRAAGVFRTLAVMCLAVGLVALAAVLFLIPLGETAKYAAMGGCALLAILGIVFIIASSAKSKKYRSVLTSWGVRDVERLNNAVERHIDEAMSRQNPQSEYSMVKHALEKAEAERWATLTELGELCSVFCDERDDFKEFAAAALEAADKASSELEALHQRRREAAAKYEILQPSVSGREAEIEEDAAAVTDTDIGREAMTLDESAAAQLRQRKRFADGTLPGLNRTLTDRESSLRALRASTANPASLASELEGVRRDKLNNEKRLDAIVCALEALERAGESLKRSLMPRIVNEAGAVMAAFSGGKYNSLGASRNFEISFESDGKTREGAYFSAGTADMAYISLRGALLRVLFSADVPPTVYDESFARIDEGRLRRILSLLDATGGAQSLVFTCRSLEGDISRRLDGANIISLDKR